MYRKVVLFIHFHKIYYALEGASEIKAIILAQFSFASPLTQLAVKYCCPFFAVFCTHQYHYTIEQYRRTKEGKMDNLDSTAGFINYKCKKDHLNNSPLQPLKRNVSLYHHDYHARQKINPLADSSNMIGKQRNSPLKNDSQPVGPLGSNYRMSFENHDSPKPARAKEKSSFFLKHENYEPPTSTYHRMSTINKRSQFSTYEKAKPRGDNLSVPKYNRMNSNSVYKAEFDILKLPFIKERKDSVNNEVSKPSYQKHKISKIF